MKSVNSRKTRGAYHDELGFGGGSKSLDAGEVEIDGGQRISVLDGRDLLKSQIRCILPLFYVPVYIHNFLTQQLNAFLFFCFVVVLEKVLFMYVQVSRKPLI
jgi:hypothetical protein